MNTVKPIPVNYSNDILFVIFGILFWGVIIAHIVLGFKTRSMNQAKGYEGGFAWGFFLGILGLITVAIRPFNIRMPQPNHFISVQDSKPSKKL